MLISEAEVPGGLMLMVEELEEGGPLITLEIVFGAMLLLLFPGVVVVELLSLEVDDVEAERFNGVRGVNVVWAG